MPFDAVTELSSLDGTTGFRINGEAEYDRSGWSVASAGDVNGDGYDDFIIGAYAANPNGVASGASYVVFGKASGFDATLELSSLDGTNGFQINGEAEDDWSGFPVASAGDVNGDGYDDLIIGASRASPNGFGSGASYVVFGKASGFDAELDLSTLDGTSGFKINGVASGDRSGWSVGTAGDFNGDGFDDVLIASRLADGNGYESGATYLVFGKAGGFAASLELSSLDGTNGFQIIGEAEYDLSGVSVASAGDVNGDGLADLIIGAPGVSPNGDYSGASYVVFGRASGFGANLELSSLDGTNGFQINGADAYAASGRSVASAGDVNGDGYDDLIIGVRNAHPNGDYSGASYVVFGRAGGFGANLELSDLDGTNGFQINGEAEYDYAGRTVAGAGDVNGDGYDDLIIGAYGATNRDYSGSSYVVFGKASGFTANLELSTIDGTNGFRINGEAEYDFSGRSVAGAGDINGDGYDDLIIGADGVDANGDYSGASYVIFGGISAAAPVDWAGTTGADSHSGGALGDQLSGLGGNDVLNGMGGDDLLDGGDLSDQLFGGDGADDLIGGGGGDLLYGDAGDDQINGGDGADKLFGGTGEDQLNGGTGNDRMAGEADIDTLNGGAGNDYLDGGLGGDIMSGGTDNDVYIVDDAGDQTIELAGEGNDIVRTTLSWTLADNVEALQLQGATHADGTGNSGANNLQGNVGDNTLDGDAGVDTINGNDGNDVIIGGLGNDLLRGGLGADTFLIAHTFGGTLETDQIYDFSSAEGDIIDLSGAFTGTIELVSAFGKAAGEMTLTFSSGITTLRLDVNGDGKADYQMKIIGDVTADSGDWLL